MLVKRRGSSAALHLDRPVFLVGAPCAGESPLFELLSRARGAAVLDASHRGELRALLAARCGMASDRLKATDATPDVLREMHRLVLAGLRDLHGDRPPGRGVRWINGATTNGWRIPFLAAAFPDAQFIYVYRQPREQLARMISAWQSGQYIAHPELRGWNGPGWSFPLIPGWEMLRGKPIEEVVAAQWASTTGRLLQDLAELPARRWCAVNIDDVLAWRGEEATLLGRFTGLSWRVRPRGGVRSRVTLRSERFAAAMEAIFPAIAPMANKALEVVHAHHASRRELPEAGFWDGVRALPERAAKALATGRVAAGLTAGTVLIPGAARAATDTVTSTLDDGSTGTLRTVIGNASPGDTIVFDPSLNGETISVTQGGIPVNAPLTIQGPGSALLTIDGGGSFAPDAGAGIDAGFGASGSPIFYLYAQNHGGPVTPASVTISGLTLQHAFRAIGMSAGANGMLVDLVLIDNRIVGSGESGGGLEATSPGSLVLQDSVVTGNVGGGIYIVGLEGDVLIDHVTITGNTEPQGAGINVDADDSSYVVVISNSTISGNVATNNRGGGILAHGGIQNVSLLDSTISGNEAWGRGGGIYFEGSGSIINSTIAGNSCLRSYDGGIDAGFAGGGVYAHQGSVTIADTTIAGNSAFNGGGVYARNTDLTTITDSIVAGNAPNDLAQFNTESFTVSYSLIENPGTALFTTGASSGDGGVPDASVVTVVDGGEIPGPGNIAWIDPQLGPLANNGGPTLTMLPAASSPVVNAGDPNYAADLAALLMNDYSMPDGGLPDGSIPMAPTTDQRGTGYPRVVGSAIDMGAVEVPPPYVDAGQPYVDAGQPVVDAGSATSDGGSTTLPTDAGTSSFTDAGTSSFTDAGTSSFTDAGISSFTDAGTSSFTDAGTSSFTDAGTSSFTDAGTSPFTDAGTSSFTDAGTSPTGGADAGTPAGGVDAGTNNTTNTGCSCNSGSDAALALMSPLATLFLRRRRKSGRAS